MKKTAVTIQAPDQAAALAGGAAMLGLPPEEVIVAPAGDGRFLVAARNQPGTFAIRLQPDRMAAFLTVTPPRGSGRPVQAEEVLQALAGENIVFGIDGEAINGVVAKVAASGSGESDVCIARGTPARPGTASTVEFGFRLHGQDPLLMAATRQNPLTARSIIKNLVVAGKVLARKVPGTPAVDGCTMTGEFVAGAAPPPDIAIRPGNHVTLLEDGVTYAVAGDLVAGYADYAGGVLAVEEPLRLSADSMQALLTIHPPDENGTGLDEELVSKLLEQQGIVFGISRTTIQKGLALAAGKNRPLHDVVVARGMFPAHGRDAVIDILVEIESSAGSVSQETDRIDFREKGFIRNVRKGQVLASKTPAEAGVDGRDVLGRVLPAEAGADKQFAAHTSNVVVSENGLSLVSEIDGMVSLVRGKIGVFEVYEVARDVDYATGNLDMAGTLKIGGWVRTGFTVRATGDILIGGGVEGTVISSAANIVIAGGVVSTAGGRIEARGDVTVRFLEGARVKAGGNVSIKDQSMRSIVIAGGSLAAVSGKGRVRGGTVSAIQGITVNEAGSEAGVKTFLIAGTNVGLKRQIVEFGKQINAKRRELAKMDTVLARYLGRGRGANLPKETARQLAQVGKRRRGLAMVEDRLAKSREELARELAAIDLSSITIAAQRGVYAGTTVIIGGRVHKVTDDIRRPVTFYLDQDGQIADR